MRSPNAIIITALAVALAAPASAARCPHGQILRVSMGRCVSIHSRLARGYVRPPRLKRIVVALPPKAAPAPERPEIAVLRERLARPIATLDRDAILLSRAAALVEAK